MNKQIHTTRFGDIDFQEDDVISFPGGIPGFEKLHRFLLIDGEEYEPFKILQSIEFPPLSFLLLNPSLIQPDFQLSLSPQTQKELDLGAAGDALVYSIVTISEGQSTANLFAPLVINPLNRRASQVLLLKSGYPGDQPL